MRSWRWCGVVSVLAGCAAGAPMDGGLVLPDTGPPGDAGMVMFVDAGDGDAGEANDAGAEDAGAMDAGAMDAGAMDAGAMDAGHDAGRPDAGTVPLVIDGTIGAAEWAGAIEVVNTTSTVWMGNELDRLLAVIRDGRLYLAIEGTIETTNAIAVYVDRGGAGLGAITDVTDTTGSLDNALSAAPYTTPMGFLPDFAWGTRAMGRAASGFDASMGWRDLATNPADLAWIDAAVAPTTCSASACETFVPLATLGGTAPRTIGLFARIHNAMGDMSPNQTLPMDDPSMPRVVSTLLTIAE